MSRISIASEVGRPRMSLSKGGFSLVRPTVRLTNPPVKPPVVRLQAARNPTAVKPKSFGRPDSNTSCF